jgi:tetratricopeptide (TPR) repeat protein
MNTVMNSNGRSDRWAASRAAEERGDYRKALEIHRKILSEEKASYAASLRAGWLCYLLGAFNEALQYYERACALSSDDWPLYGIMNCLRALGDEESLAIVANSIYAAPRTSSQLTHP